MQIFLALMRYYSLGICVLNDHKPPGALFINIVLCPSLCFSEESDDKLSKTKNDSAGKWSCRLIQSRWFIQSNSENERWSASVLTSLCLAATDDFGSDEDNDFGEEEDEDAGSDYEEKRGKKAKKAKVEKASKRVLKRKRGGGNYPGFQHILQCVAHDANITLCVGVNPNKKWILKASVKGLILSSLEQSLLIVHLPYF